MGWSCRAEASKVMEQWQKLCIASDNSQNTWLDRGKRYMWEVSCVEHDDGAITGRIFQLVNEGDKQLAYPKGSFRIEGDGTITRAPKFLKGKTIACSLCGKSSIAAQAHPHQGKYIGGCSGSFL